MTAPGSEARGRTVTSGDELRHLSGVVNDVIPPVEGALARVGTALGCLDRRGWNAAQVDDQWSAVKRQWTPLKTRLEVTSRSLRQRAQLADQLEHWLVGRSTSAQWLSAPTSPAGAAPAGMPSLLIPLSPLVPVALGALSASVVQAVLERQARAVLHSLPVILGGGAGTPSAPPPETKRRVPGTWPLRARPPAAG